MTDIVIPVKKLSKGKQRLSGLLTPTVRAGLVLAMLEDLLAMVSFIDHGQILVVASDDLVFDVARKFGANILREDRPWGYNSAVNAGFAALGDVENVAVFPADIPLARSREISRLIAPSEMDKPLVRLAPSRDKLGTNGLFLSSRNLIRPGFGPDSYTGHCRSASAMGIDTVFLEAPSLAHDIDTPLDLQEFIQHRQPGLTLEFMESVHCAGLAPASEKKAVV